MLIIAVSFSAFASLSVRSLANSLALEWDGVEDALWYDIYIDDGFIARLGSSQLSFTVENLEGNREYKVSWQQGMVKTTILMSRYRSAGRFHGTVNTVG